MKSSHPTRTAASPLRQWRGKGPRSAATSRSYQIAVFHINDSKNAPGARKDRHENIGFGRIGFNALDYIVHHPDFTDVPKILETPYIPSEINPKKSYAPYKYEIEMLRNRVFDPGMKERILHDSENRGKA